MKEKIFLTRTLHDFALKELKKKFQVEIHTGKIPIPQSTLKTKIKEIDGLICFPYDKIDKEIIQSAKNLKVISTYSVGYDHIDTQFAKENKIRVGYTPEVLTNATADMAFALLLDSLRRISEGDRIIRKGKWKQIYGAYDYVGLDLQSKTLGIIGLGRIGKILAKRAKAFDMKIIYHNRSHVSKSREKSLGVKYVSLDKLITQSDVISIHVPHTSETDQMFNNKIFKKMKNSSFLINTARGKIVNEKDLGIALKKKIIAGAGLDVFEQEPYNGPLNEIERCLLTAHMGSMSADCRARMEIEATQEAVRLISGETLISMAPLEEYENQR